MASERIVAAGVVGSYAVTQLMTMLQESMQLELLKQSAMRFFRQHDVSIQTQIQVSYIRAPKETQTPSDDRFGQESTFSTPKQH